MMLFGSALLGHHWFTVSTDSDALCLVHSIRNRSLSKRLPANTNSILLPPQRYLIPLPLLALTQLSTFSSSSRARMPHAATVHIIEVTEPGRVPRAAWPGPGPPRRPHHKWRSSADRTAKISSFGSAWRCGVYPQLRIHLHYVRGGTCDLLCGTTEGQWPWYHATLAHKPRLQI